MMSMSQLRAQIGFPIANMKSALEKYVGSSKTSTRSAPQA